MKTTRNFVGFVMMYALSVSMTACVGGVSNQCGDNVTTASGGAGGEGGAAGGVPVGGGFPAICQLDECDPAGPKEGKLECDDADPKTADRCIATKCGGACAHVKVECDGADTGAVQAAVCDDGDPCTVDRCAVSSCEHLPKGECNPCVATACASAEAECGTIEADCDQDGTPEPIACGTCDEPTLCVNNTCSDQCLSKYSAECEADDKPSAWAFDIACNDGEIYKYLEGELTYCLGCPANANCQKLDYLLPDGVQVLCCP
jgi:hypothetical protein